MLYRESTNLNSVRGRLHRMRRDEEDDIGVLDTSAADKSATANDQKPPGAG